MNGIETSRLIEKVGGDMAFARLLGIDGERRIQQRVNNWKRRGLPSRVALEHYKTLMELRERFADHEEVA